MLNQQKMDAIIIISGKVAVPDLYYFRMSHPLGAWFCYSISYGQLGSSDEGLH